MDEKQERAETAILLELLGLEQPLLFSYIKISNMFYSAPV